MNKNSIFKFEFSCSFENIEILQFFKNYDFFETFFKETTGN